MSLFQFAPVDCSHLNICQNGRKTNFFIAFPHCGPHPHHHPYAHHNFVKGEIFGALSKIGVMRVKYVVTMMKTSVDRLLGRVDGPKR